MRVTAACVLGLCAFAPLPAAAQAPAASRPGPYVLDVHVATSGLPQDPTFLPEVPSATVIPVRGLGIDVGAHVYLISLGPARLGIGVSLMRVSGGSSPERPTGGSSTTGPPSRPDVDTSVTTIAPQLSFNFGAGEGWSYISAGVGQAQVRTTTSAFLTTPARAIEGDRLQSLNVGGGARWFTNRHFAFSFDVRFHLVAAGSGEAATPATTLVAASAGISLK
jgi:hypothetical protein